MGTPLNSLIVSPATVGGRLSVHSVPSASPSAQPDSWAVGMHALNGTPNPALVQGIQMTAFLPSIPSGLTSAPGPYYMLVMSVVFPNGRFLQIDVRASPAGTDGCLIFACYQSVYDIAKFPGGVSAFAIDPEVAAETYTLALWRDAGAARWRYGIARGTPPNLTIERNDFLSNLDPNFADADAFSGINVNQADEWYGTSAALQEFAALESYDWSSSDWSRIGTLEFGPALSFLEGTASATWPAMTASRAVLACTTGTVCRDPDGRPYLGLIGCCNATPSFVTAAGLFQGKARSNTVQIGQGSAPGAAAGDVLWADLPSILSAAFAPDAIRSGNGTALSYRVQNPNGFSLVLGLRRAIRANPSGTLFPDPSSDLGPLKVPAGVTTESQNLSTSTNTEQSFFDVLVEVWSGIPGNAPASLLTSSGWLPKVLAVDDEPPATSPSVVGTRGNGAWYLSAVMFGLAGSDALSGIGFTWYRLDGTNATAFAPYIVPVVVSTDGSHVLVYFSVDRAGNAEDLRTLPFEIDATPPSLEILSPASGAHLPNGTFRTTWTAQDAGSGIDHYTVRLGSDPPINVSRALSYAFVGLPNGTYVVRVTASDWAGNVATQVVTVQVGIVPADLALPAAIAVLVTTALVLAVVLTQRRRKPPAMSNAETIPEEPAERKG